MKFSKLFKTYKEETSGKNYVFLEDVYSVLLQRDNKILKANLKRSLQTFQGGAKIINGKECATATSLLKYLFQHSSASAACNDIVSNIENELLCKEKSQEHIYSSLELYKIIAKTPIQKSQKLFNQLEFIESDISTLIVEHKPLFKETEWKRICWFEDNFSKSVQFKEDISYEELLSQKFSKFQLILNLIKCSQAWIQACEKQITHKTDRDRVGERDNQVRLLCGQVHVAAILESGIKSLLNIYVPESIGHVISFDVTGSRGKNCLWVVFEKNDDSIIDIDSLCLRVFYSLKRKHNVYLEKIFVIPSNILRDYISDDDNVARFLLRDDVETKRFDSVSEIWYGDPHIDGTIECEGNTQCEYCFVSNTTQPLSTDSFNIVHEWYRDTPIEAQILLEGFINQNTVRRLKDPEQYLLKKIEKIYMVHDVLLNIRNKNYMGCFQQNNTNRLLIEYKSIGSVFDITSAAGATTSLSHAEKVLKEEASTDICYYNTYLKEHPLNYKSSTGEHNVHVNLRSCHLILMLDNLVRLKYVADPNPGEHRSKQLCTLPITLQGLPLNTDVTDEWHNADCDGQFSCACKQPTELFETDIKHVLLEPCEDESLFYNQFSNLMVFGNLFLWKKLPDNLFHYVEAPKFQQIDPSNEQTAIIQDDNYDSNAECSELDVDLVDVLASVECTEDDTAEEVDVFDSDDDIQQMSGLEKSMDEMSILDDEDTYNTSSALQDLLGSFGFKKFRVPALLCRHPPPAIGRDDDILKIKEILDDVLMKMGYEADPSMKVNRILCGPDNKIGKCLLSLIKQDTKYRVFLPEFPLLHLRKSKITILFSAYKEAGILQLVKFMRDEELEEWAKLISIQHIDMATKHVKRLALSFHLAFLISFTQYLDTENLQDFLNDLEMAKCTSLSEKWSKKYNEYIAYGCSRNATFSLHVDMMNHCDSVIAISLAERLGGATGYGLLLAAVKKSLLFSFVNNANAYAPYCVKLLYHHYSAGYFHRCLKETLYSTPFKGSNRNFASDTKREMDHLEVVKGFRAGSTVESVSCRMALIDSLNETTQPSKSNSEDSDKMGWEITDVDINHIYPTAELILRRGGLSLEESLTPYNVYTKVPLILPVSILDSASDDVGKYLLMRYVQKEKMFNLNSTQNILDNTIQGPAELVSRAKRSKGITIKRTLKSKVLTAKTERQAKEESRQKNVLKETKMVDCYSSENNACQSLLKADSTKPKVIKAIGIQRALKKMVQLCSGSELIDEYIQLNLPYIPKLITCSMKICTIEFAGVKFKIGNVKSGDEYLKLVEKMLNKVLDQPNRVSNIVVCEEKYNFTPDDFKASTRDQRKGKERKDVGHLKSTSSIIGSNTLDKDVITKTDQGKKLISTYLAENIDTLDMKQNVCVIVDSQLTTKKDCICGGACDCNDEYCVPIVCKFNDNGRRLVTNVDDIKQRKGEAEMAVCDWLIHLQTELEDGDTAVCYVTSADIDAVYIHLVAISKYWPRNEENKFKNAVYVVLQKAGGKVDIYNITSLLTLFETVYGDKNIGVKLAFTLCIGGNDFLPKFHGISHDTVLKTVFENTLLRHKLFMYENDRYVLNTTLFTELIKHIYTPKRLKNSNITYEEVRAITIGKVEDNSKLGGIKTADPKKWLPPKSVIEKLSILVQLQIDYLQTVGIHEAQMPDFLQSGCLRKNSSGEVEYDFGPEAQFVSLEDLPTFKRKKPKRRLDDTPQRGARRKRPLTSTPKSKH